MVKKASKKKSKKSTSSKKITTEGGESFISMHSFLGSPKKSSASKPTDSSSTKQSSPSTTSPSTNPQEPIPVATPASMKEFSAATPDRNKRKKQRKQSISTKSKPEVTATSPDSPSPSAPPTSESSEIRSPIEPSSANQISSTAISSSSSSSSPTEPNWEKIFFSGNSTPIGDVKYTFDLPREARENQKTWHMRMLQEANEIVSEMDQGILLAVDYDGGLNKAYAKFYDLQDHSIKIWIDTTDHQPYCYHRLPKRDLENNLNLINFSGFDRIETVKIYDNLSGQDIDVSKIYGHTPTDIGGAHGVRDILEGAWEAHIRYHHNFIYDRDLIPGMYYSIHQGNIIPIKPKIDEKLLQQLQEVFSDAPAEIQDIANFYHPIFSTPVPALKRLAFDIEVEEAPDGGVPNPMTAKQRIISVSFAATDGLKKVYVLDRDDFPMGQMVEDFPADAEVLFFKEEKDLVEETFRLIWDYPLIITFNGDNFDNMYLYHRARDRLNIDERIIPIYVTRSGGMVTHNTDYKHSIHIDIFQFYANRSIKGYAFGGAYLKNSLEDIASSLLGSGKVKHEGILIGDMNYANLIFYNMVDSLLTLELTTFNDQLPFHLLVTLMRITKLPLQDVFRYQISAWIRSLLLSEHRRKNILFPRGVELEQRGKFDRNNVDRFQGAYVITPKPGIHFDVAVLDFSSLYPSIIKTRNLSYETVNCHHPECKSNLLPNTKYWACTKKLGIFAYVVGYLRDVRVKWFKPLSSKKSVNPQDRQTAKVMAAALKVFINGAYGVFGSPIFALFYLPVAEATTGIGRFSIQKTIDKAESMGVEVLYGDSDSVFLHKPTKPQVDELVKWSQEHLDLDLELEKTYQFLALSERKKNYVGVRQGGEEVDLKGMMAKKHNTPDFIRNKFKEVQEILTTIVDMDTFTKDRSKIIKIIQQTNRLIGKLPEKGGFHINDYAISVVLKKPLDRYDKAMPQHVRAASLLPDVERNALEPGSFITYVKTRNKDGVKPLQMASISDLDYAKYKEMLRSTFEQLLDALNISYEEVMGIKKLSSFF